MSVTSPFLTKSDFQIAQECPTKLYYRKHQFPTEDDDNEYLEMLADGGFMVGVLAKLLYPDGVEVRGNLQEAIATTEQLLYENQNITLFEPAIAIGDQLVRVDILIKSHDRFDLIEVKSKSFDSIECREKQDAGKKYWETTDFQPYLSDVAFQKKVLREKFPEAEVRGFLLLPDKAKHTALDGMVSWFTVERDETHNNRTTARFIGSTEQREALQEDNPLTLVNVDQWIDPMLPSISAQVPRLIESIVQDKKIETQISCHCKQCEYKTISEAHPISGFDLCWKELGIPKPLILDLTRLGNINQKKTGTMGRIDALIQSGKTALSDIPESFLYSGKGEPSYNGRPLYQRTGDAEILKSEFFDAIRDIEYPLFFIDFETSQMALPYHRNMRPFSKVIFQWSCHRIDAPGAEPVHSGWLNTDDQFPNFEFVKTLRAEVGDSGSLFTWSSYENTQLRSVYDSLEQWGVDDDDLKNWLRRTARFDKDDPSRIVDLNKLAEQYYFHPMMEGRTSIKVTLPSVLNSFHSERIRMWLQQDGLFKIGDDGKVINPYELLPEPAPILDGKALRVKEGGSAMRAYQDMVYGLNRNNKELREEYARSLERYCKLDTLAMIIIWEHWMSLR
jgi:hypothetical protein